MSSEEEIKSNLIEAQRFRIAELKEENEKLEAENKRLHGLVCQMCDGNGAVGNCFDSIDCPECSLYNAHDDAITENSERLQAENKRLRHALKAYSFYSESHPTDNYISIRVDIHERAQEALNGE